jgi:hypothetical protein
MPHYWVFWDEIVGRIRIHRAKCKACKYGTGLYKVKSTEWPQVDYDWEPANSYAEACEIAAALKHRKPASISRPKRIATYAILDATIKLRHDREVGTISKALRK